MTLKAPVTDFDFKAKARALLTAIVGPDCDEMSCTEPRPCEGCATRLEAITAAMHDAADHSGAQRERLLLKIAYEQWCDPSEGPTDDELDAVFTEHLACSDKNPRG